MNKSLISAFCVIVFVLTCLSVTPGRTARAAIRCDDSARYSAKPLDVTSAVRPNVLIIFSNDETNFRAGYGPKGPSDPAAYDDSIEYYGYFDPRKEYIYGGGYFSPAGYVDFSRNHRCATSGRWSGNFLNWLTMCHADFTRKAMTGGRRFVDDKDRTILERGNIPDDPDSDPPHTWSRTVPDASPYTPFSGCRTFSNTGTALKVSPSGIEGSPEDESLSYNVRVEVCVAGAEVSPEDNCTHYESGSVWKPEGLLQRFKDKANFGLMSYSAENSEQGGILRVNVHDMSGELDATSGRILTSTGLIGFINAFNQVRWDPLAEVYYEAVRYFKGLKEPTKEYCDGVNDSDGGFPALCNRNGNDWIDPLTSWCQKSFIIIISDEYPSRDSDALPGSSWPASLTNPDASVNVSSLAGTVGDMEGITGNSEYVGNSLAVPKHMDDCGNPVTVAGLGEVRGICPNEGDSQGSFYVGGLAYHAHTTDLRDDLPRQQTVFTYAIASRATSSPRGYIMPGPPMNPLYLAAKYGGFHDLDGDGKPGAGEWEGGSQAGCMPSPSWNCRWPRNFAHAEEGRDFEEALERFFKDILKESSSGSAAAAVAYSEGGEGQLFQASFEPVRTEGENEVTWIGFLQALWIDSQGNLREDTSRDGRLDPKIDKIIRLRFDSTYGTTVVDRYSDLNGNNTADADECDRSSADYDSCVSGSKEPGQTLSSLKPIWEAASALGQRDLAEDPRVIMTFVDKNLDGIMNLDEYMEFSVANAEAIGPFLDVALSDTSDLISYIRGTDIAGWRSRSLGARRYLLADIVHSSPTPVDRPMESYDIIYGDKTYLAYYNKYRNRPTYVYAGANDGMLHAFYGGTFHPATSSGAAYIEAESGKELGREMWAFIPGNLLPHLKWLACPDYPHVFYLDLKPRVADARIFSAEWADPTGIHPYGWGTILICGMGFGGAPISVTADFGTGSTVTRTFGSSYFAVDITDPEKPQLLWEKRLDQGGFTLGYPSVARIQRGSDGPADASFTDQKWLLIVGNGPADLSGNPGGKGLIYIVNLATGDVEATLPTPELPDSVTEFMASAVSVDVDKNFGMDAAYIGSAIKRAGEGYGGRMYRISANTKEGEPEWDIGKWSVSVLFDAEKPVTAAPAASQIDDKTWVYFGTGRFLGPDDKTSSDQQAFFGIQDPCSPRFESCASTVSKADLMDVTGFKVYETGYVTAPGLPEDAQWEDILDLFDEKAGFVLYLEQPGGGAPSERVLTKPTIMGGTVIFPSFIPDKDVCAFCGEGRLYSLYYKTGTAYKESLIGTDPNDTRTINKAVFQKVLSSIAIGPGSPSRPAVHAGRENGGKTLTQTGAGTVEDLKFQPAEKMKSGFIYWKEME